MSGVHMCQGMHKSIFHRDRDHCVMAFTGVLSLHHMKHLLCHMQYTAAREGHATEGWKMGLTYLLLLSAPMDWLNIKLNWSLIRTKLWKTFEVWLWLHPLPGYTIQQGMSFARPGSMGIQQIRSILVGNVKFTKWQRSCYDSLSPPWPRHLIY